MFIIGTILICCILFVAIGKNCKRQNCNTQQTDLQASRCPRTTQATTRTGPDYITQSAHYPGGDLRPPSPYNTTEPHEALTTVPYPYPVPYSQQPPASYQQQPDNWEAPSDVPVSVDIPAYESSDVVHGAFDYDNVKEPCQEMKTLVVPGPPSYAELFKY